MSNRRDQPITAGLGVHFASPVKRRDKKKTNTLVEVPGHAEKRKQLEEKIAMLKRPKSDVPDLLPDPPVSDDPVESLPAIEDLAAALPDDTIDSAQTARVQPQPESPSKKKRLQPDPTSIQLVDTWNNLLPTLVQPLLVF